MKSHMKRIYIILTIFLCSSFFQSCGRAELTENIPENQSTLQEDMLEAMTAEKETVPETEENDIKSSSFWEADGYIYALSDRQISRIDIDTGNSIILWDNWEKGEKTDYTIYEKGGGILYKDKLYFLETAKEGAALSVIGVDGTEYRRLIPLDSTYGYRMYLKNNILYVYQKWLMKGEGYEIREDGGLEKVENDFSYRRVLKNTGYSVGEINQNYLLSIDYFYSEEEKALYLTDIQTMETSFLATCGQNTGTIHMDKDYLYLRRTDAERNMDIYEKISLESGEISEIFSQEKPEYMPDAYWTPDTMNLSVQNGYLYYPQMEDYRIYVMRRKLADPQKAEKVGEAFYDIGISGVGSPKELREKTYSKSYPDIDLFTCNIWYLTVDERFSGGERINQILYEKEVEHAFALSEEDTAYLESEIKQYGDCTSWYYTSRFSQVFCLEDRLLSFYQYGYLSEGTGMDQYFRRGYTFDLQSGEALSLGDIIQNNAKELEDILMRYVENGIVKEWEETNFSPSFYLTAEGIVFYYSFDETVYNDEFIQMVIPYSEFEMKIDIGK